MTFISFFKKIGTPRTHAHVRGFSLVEVLVYMMVLVLATSVVISTFFSLRTVFERNRVERELADAATGVLERIGRETRYASSVTGASVFGTSPGVLELTQTPTTTRFYVSGSDVIVRQNGVDIGILDPTHVTVTSLVFTEYVQATSTAVRVALTLSVATPFATTVKTFYTTALLRGSIDD